MEVLLLHEHHHYYQLILIPVKIIMKQLPHYATLRSPQEYSIKTMIQLK
jgi:hypothetical protein